MVGDKYTRLTLLTGFFLLRPYSCPAVLQEVGEVIYSVAENNMHISTFTSATWASWCRDCGVQQITTAAFHPQANGMVERLHRQMKDTLRARGGTAAWVDHLPWVMLGIRASPKESGTSAGEATLGHVLVVPGQLLPTTAPPADTPVPPGSSQLPSGPTLKQLPHQLRRGPLLSMYSVGVWDCRWRTTTRAPIWCWRRVPMSSSYSWGEDRGGEQGSAEAPCRAGTTCGR